MRQPEGERIVSEARKYLAPVHTSPETAFVIEDYPFGFKLRCKKRVWIETSPKKGQRVVFQTTDPRRAVETWNAPKRSTYSDVAVLDLDERGYLQTDGISVNATEEQFAAFRERAKESLDSAGLARLETAEKTTAAISAFWKKRLAKPETHETPPVVS
jgi:hypothetical protein